MITLAKDCLLFHLSDGEMVPFSPEMICVELAGESSRYFDPQTATEAAKAVFHYFKNDLGRQSVTADEFATAMERALRGFSLAEASAGASKGQGWIIEADLAQLAGASAAGCELLFFPELRRQLRDHLRQRPRVLYYRGLRRCVKQMAGARRWTERCRDLEEQIVTFVRQCALAEPSPALTSLVVE